MNVLTVNAMLKKCNLALTYSAISAPRRAVCPAGVQAHRVNLKVVHLQLCLGHLIRVLTISTLKKGPHFWRPETIGVGPDMDPTVLILLLGTP